MNDRQRLFPSALGTPAALPERINMAVFASGTGTNFRALCEAARSGDLGCAEPMLLICNRECGAMDIARDKGIPAYVFAPRDFDTPEAWEEKILSVVHAFEIDFIALAGYLRKVGSTLLGAFTGKIVNLHPALLPAYPGLHSIERIWNDATSDDPQLSAAARAAAGVTVHIADEHFDHGPILAQQSVPVENFASLAEFEAAVHRAEHALFPATVATFAATLKRTPPPGTPYWLKRAQENRDAAS
ncbi:MAG: phosphoribosylglycinamide formyltransferase [Actinomycetaceae bacterium]|nr:phosphoribosylglycinamide formyltransferase [Actinomycetaceae bacterium]MDY5854828.1 phosphoribosylglycinamide formyltransferase [Arcanobacterium sp.]